MRVRVVVFLVALTASRTALAEETGPRQEAEGGYGRRDDPHPSDSGSALFSVSSAQNASGHWSTKVRLQHAEADGTEELPVHLQVQRWAPQRPGGARTVALEATLSGSLKCHTDDFTKISKPLHTSPCTPSPAPQSPQPSPSTIPVQYPERPTPSKPQQCPPPCPSCPSCPNCPTSPPCPSLCHAQIKCPDPPKCPSPCPSFPTIPSCPVCPSPRKSIPAGYKHHRGLGYYRFHLTPVTWFEAKATCEREGAHLIVINSKEEAKMVARLYETYNIPETHYGIRVGFDDLLEEGKFYTVLGQPLLESGFSEWSTNEPSSTGGNEDCGSIYQSALLNDVPCDMKGTFVCELPQ